MMVLLDTAMAKQMEGFRSEMSDLMQKQLKVLESLSKSQDTKRPNKGRGAQGKAKKDECYHCGEKGHFIGDCLHKTSQSQDSQSSSQGNANPPAQ